MRARRASAGLAFGVMALVWASTAPAAGPKVASINLCTDQLILILADPDQVLGLSPYARDDKRSWAAAQADTFPRLSGLAEDVLVLRPDLVFAGRYTKRATRELLARQGLRVVEFEPARSIAEARKQIREAGALLGHPERAEASIRAIDAAVARIRASVTAKPLSVLPLSRRGWAAGSGTLLGSLIDTVGLSVAAKGGARPSGGFLSLESIVALRPDLLLVSSDDERAEDQGSALLQHSVLAELYPPYKRIVIPERLTACGGPMLTEALSRLAKAVEAPR
ncbi:ABC transporter substrate-binding protein [Enterovirga rhinocerotis]|uniref:Iron complex transport system substrate-binding protein n=1 Tax=Enterovirga rhinocerotis TaxID=1339210 RepID=A0A4R7BWZ3_9HYPH|nr:ABC transporter substrate-binding protein [Enterovirga rhinocerotis]TDR90101.1 iron complex transport system substrate-binding protein [Enterovirga rhinocerotis]